MPELVGTFAEFHTRRELSPKNAPAVLDTATFKAFFPALANIFNSAIRTNKQAIAHVGNGVHHFKDSA